MRSASTEGGPGAAARDPRATAGAAHPEPRVFTEVIDAKASSALPRFAQHHRPYLGVLGVTATTIGIVAGFGELLGYGARLVSGYLGDRTGSIGRLPSPGICSTCSLYRSWHLPVPGRSPLC